MAAVLEKTDPAAKYQSAVDEQIAQATSRVRTHDLALGTLLLAAMVLVYATAMIVLDRYAVLPEWVRQLALLGFLAAAGGVAYRTIVLPLRRRVNPLYAAVLVEKTIDDAKNSVAGYVEAQERGDVHPAVKAAMSARAAKAAGDADVNQAVDHRSLLYAGAVAVAFLLALVVLFFVFRPAQFASLIGRTFVPFSSEVIASRTQLELVEPAGDVTITTGQSVAVRVHVGGKVPNPDKPDRVRVLLRHTPTAADYEVVPMEPGENARDWQVRIPDHLVRNGFWFKVAGGDDETAEHKVTVRSLPLFSEFEVSYDYPAYIRRLPEPPNKDPNLNAIRGTKVTLTGRTNRTVKDGRLTFDPPAREPVVGRPVPDRPDSLRFEFYLTASGKYRLAFTSSENERSAESQPFDIRVIEDLPPQIDVLKPEPDEIPLPANGQLAVDARFGDDFGIDKVTLKIKLVEPAGRALADRPYQGGKSFRRETDDTWPTLLEYKDSVDLAKLTDEGGAAVELKAGMVLEYWLEATDNRTRPGAKGPEPDPNVGKSQVKRVRVTPPVEARDDKQNLDANKQQRKQDEAQHNKQQDQRLNTERRDPNPQQPQPEPPKKNPDEPQPEPKKPPEGKEDPPMPPKTDNEQPKTPPESKPDDKQPMPKEGNPMPGGMPMTEPGMGGMNPMTETAPPPSNPGDEKAREQAKKDAERVQNELDKQNNGEGDSKPGPMKNEEQPTPPAEQKPKPGKMPPDGQQKNEPQQGDPNPMGGGMSEPKPGGGMEQPPPGGDQPKAEPKPEPGMMGGDQPQADPKTEPKNDQPGGGAGSDRPNPQPMNPMGDPSQTPDKTGGGGEAKPGTQQKQPKPDGMPPKPGADQPKDPTGGAGAPKPDEAKPEKGNDPGADKPAGGDPMGGMQPEGGEPKPEKTPAGGEPKAGKPKPGPKDNPGSPMPQGGADEPKPTPGGDPMGAKPDAQPMGENPPDGGNPMAGAPKAGEDKPAPGQDRKQPKGGGSEQPKLTPEQEKELADAAKDLTSPDPDKRKAAQDKLDKMVGEKNRKKAEEIAKGLQSKDPKERQAAEEKLKNELKEQANKGGEKKNGDGTAQKNPDGGPKGKPDPKEVADALKDLNSPDPAKQQAARDKLDKTVGPEARKQAEELLNDLNSKDPVKKAAAEKKLEEWKKEAEKQAKGGEPKGDKEKNPPGGKGKEKDQTAGGKKVDPKEVEQSLNDLNDPDPKKQAEAEKELDDMLGKGTAQKAKEFNKKMGSENQAEQSQGRKGIDDLMKQAEEMAKKQEQPKGKPPTKEEIDELAKKAEDLNSPDEQKRKAAEKALDEKFGEQARKELQEALKDPKKAEELRKKLEDQMKAARGGKDPNGNNPPKGGPADDPELAEAMKVDARNRAKSAELQLDHFEKNKDNKDLLNKLGMTPEQYQQFLDNFRKEVARLKKTADDLEQTATKPPAPPTRNVSGGNKVEAGIPGPTGNGGSVGPVFAAPGYADALKLFQQGATKVPAKRP